MKNLVVLFAVAILLSACSTTYYGYVTYYMPDGTIETYKAHYIASSVKEIPSTIYCDWGNNSYMITNGIPYKFFGNGTTYNDSTSKEYLTYNLEGKSYQIPMEVWKSIQAISKTDGQLDKELCERLLKDYIIKRIHP